MIRKALIISIITLCSINVYSNDCQSLLTSKEVSSKTLRQLDRLHKLLNLRNEPVNEYLPSQINRIDDIIKIIYSLKIARTTVDTRYVRDRSIPKRKEKDWNYEKFKEKNPRLSHLSTEDYEAFIFNEYGRLITDFTNAFYQEIAFKILPAKDNDSELSLFIGQVLKELNHGNTPMVEMDNHSLLEFAQGLELLSENETLEIISYYKKGIIPTSEHLSHIIEKVEKEVNELEGCCVHSSGCYYCPYNRQFQKKKD